MNFHASTGESQNLHIDGVLMSKMYKVSAKIIQRGYVSSHGTVMQNFKRELLVVAKII